MPGSLTIFVPVGQTLSLVADAVSYGTFNRQGDPIVQSAHVSSTRLAIGTFRCRKTAANTYVAYRIS